MDEIGVYQDNPLACHENLLGANVAPDRKRLLGVRL
jgi:hypothetical protein